ncbi:hypothetical protein [Celeribacter sp.]|uniref:hypothetical protein n=1 Tax=Celeribacter sp. TaxID=1890673 RepID=UPI003A92D59E
MNAPAAYSSRKSGLGLVFGAAAVILVLIVLVAQLPLASQKSIVAEGGLFEVASMLGYIGCIVLLFVLWPREAVWSKWYFVVVLAVCAARELDLDKIPFTEGLLKLRQYTGDTVGPVELVISAAILLGIIASCLILLRRETRAFLAGLARFDAASVAVLLGVVFLVFSKSIDGIARKLEPFGISVSEDQNNLFGVIEEVGEFGIPLMFAIAIILISRSPFGRDG